VPRQGRLAWLRRRRREKPPPEGKWPRSVVVATKLDHPGGIAIDAMHAYFTTGGFAGADNAIRRIPLEGGEAELVARIDGAIPSGHLALDDDRVYWTSEFGGLVASAPKAEGPVVILARDVFGFEISVKDGFVYWVDGAVHRRPLAERGTIQCLAAARRSAGELIVEDEWVWWREDSGLWRCALGDGVPGEPELVLPRDVAGAVGAIAGGGDLLFCGLAPSGHSRLVAVPTQTSTRPIDFRLARPQAQRHRAARRRSRARVLLRPGKYLRRQPVQGAACRRPDRAAGWRRPFHGPYGARPARGVLDRHRVGPAHPVPDCALMAGQLPELLRRATGVLSAAWPRLARELARGQDQPISARIAASKSDGLKPNGPSPP
jgi:hypothetical protein